MAKLQPDNKQETIQTLSPDSKSAQTTGSDGSQHAPVKEGNLSVKWFTALGAYKPHAGIKVEKLICGKAAFSAIYKAIENAKKSVDIIIWGFDPMMRFNPDEPNNLTIGELLEKKAQQGVECRVMVWYDNLGKLAEPTLIGYEYIRYDPNKLYDLDIDIRPQQLRLNEYLQERDELKDRIAQYESNHSAGQVTTRTEDWNYQWDQKQLAKLEQRIAKKEQELSGYSKGSGGGGGPKQQPAEQRKAYDWIDRVTRHKIPNLELKTRNFTFNETTNIVNTLKANQNETNSTWWMRRAMGNVPSHHQKVVLIDYELPSATTCTAFVMGHNMHRNYWDTPEHYYYDEDANRVQGFGPWQDISMQVWGDILFDINDNFVTAWSRISPIEPDTWQARRAAVKESDFKPMGNLQVQFCRTQPQIQLPQTGDYERSILAIYKKAIENSRNYIFIENQYFRYETMAKQIKQHATLLKTTYQEFDIDRDALYLFVLTNTPKDNNFSSSTYAMFKELGQQQLMPEAQRELYRQEDLKAYQQANPQIGWDGNPTNFDTKPNPEVISEKDQDHIKDVRSKDDVTKISQEGQGWDIDGIEGKKPFELEHEAMAEYGLKVIIGTLTTDSSVTNNKAHFTQGDSRAIDTYHSRYTRYRDIYIHTKLLVVDDLFTFLGSANINTRSFWADSESGIAIPDPEMAFNMRNELWNLHAKKSVNQATNNTSKAILCDTKDNYDHWNTKMNDNWKHKAKGEPLDCHLTRFWDTETGYAKAAD